MDRVVQITSLSITLIAGLISLPTWASKLDPSTLVIAKVSHNPKKHYRYLKPMVEYAASKMSDLGITNVDVKMVRNNEQMINLLQKGAVDWVTETSISSVLFEQQAGAEILLRKWKKGVPMYRTVFFTRIDSGINTLADLKGKKLALEDTGSSSAYFIPSLILNQEGLKLQHLPTPRSKVLPDRVGYLLTGEEINISTWVHKGVADAGAFNNQDWHKEDHLPQIFQEDMKIFAQSKPLPRAMELVRGDLELSIKRRLKEVLLAADKDPKAQSALIAYQKTTKFDELSGDQLQDLRNLYSSIPALQTDQP